MVRASAGEAGGVTSGTRYAWLAYIPSDLCFKDFCSADSEVALSGTLTDTAIVQAVSAAMMQMPAHQLIFRTMPPPTVIQMRRPNRTPAGLSGRQPTPRMRWPYCVTGWSATLWLSPQPVDIMHEIVRPMSATWTCILLRSLLLK